MNRVQEAVASVLGLDEELNTTQEELQEIQSQLESVVNTNRLLERAFEDLDYMNLYDLTKIQDVLPAATRKKTVDRLRAMRHDNPLAKQGIRLIVRFTLGKGIRWISKNNEIRRTLNAFWTDPDNRNILTSKEAMKEFVDEIATDGEKFLTCFEAKNVKPYLKLAEVPMEEVVDIIYDPDNRRVPVYYKRKFRELVYDGKAEQYKNRIGRSGDNFKVLYYLDHRIRPERLAEIEDRIKIPEGKKAKTDGEQIRMMHFYVNPIWTKNGRRGVSELFASREWFRVFKEFMQDRAIINRAATSIAFQRTVKGGPAAVARVSGTMGGVPVGNTNREFGEIGTLSKPVAGATYDSNEAVDLKWMKTETGAQNAREDARMLLMVGGSGMGTNVHYFGEGGDANLATAQAMELPMVKNYEDWQSWLTSVFLQIFQYVLYLAYGDNIPFEERTTEAASDPIDSVAPGTTELKLKPGNGKTPARLEVREIDDPSVEDVVSWDFPPIITKDVVKHMTAWAQLTQQVAPGDLTVKLEAIKGALNVLGVANVDQLIEQITAEEEELKAQKDAQHQMMMDNLASGGGGEPPQNGKSNGNGNVPGWPSAGSGADSQTKRLAKGKPEGRKTGRVAADARPGVG